MYTAKNPGVAFKAAIGTAPAAAKSAGTVNGTGIDRAAPSGIKYDSCKLVQSIGATSGSPASFSVTSKIQDSADNSVFADYVPPLGQSAQVVGIAAGVAEVNVDLSSARRYVRVQEVTAFVGGTAPTVLTNATVLLSGPDKLPAV